MKKSIIAISILFASNQVCADVRTESMGGAGVASNNYLTASSVNPALLANHDESDDFGILLPSINLMAYDSDEILNKIDLTQDSYSFFDDALSAAKLDPSTKSNLDRVQLSALDLRNNFNSFDDSSAKIDGSVFTSIVIPSDYSSFSLFFKTSFDIKNRFFVNEDDLSGLNLIINSDLSNSDDVSKIVDYDMENIQSSAQVLGASITEGGVSIAKSFNLNGHRFNIGLTPKYQRVDLFNYISGVENFEEDNFDLSSYTTDNSNFNLDLGVTYDISESFTLGLVAKDLIENEYKTALVSGSEYTYLISPQVTIGAAYNGSFINAAIDIELLKSEGFDIDNEKFVKFGVELNAVDWIQLRAGYKYDMNDIRDDIFTAGIGASPFGLINLDIGVSYSDDRELGVGLQTAFTF